MQLKSVMEILLGSGRRVGQRRRQLEGSHQASGIELGMFDFDMGDDFWSWIDMNGLLMGIFEL